MFAEMRENNKDQFIDDEYQQRVWQSRERKAKPSDTLDVTGILTNLFESFGEIYRTDSSKKIKI